MSLAPPLRFFATTCAISRPDRFSGSKTVRRASGGALGPRPDHSSPLTVEGRRSGSGSLALAKPGRDRGASRRRSWDLSLRSFAPAGRLAGLWAASTHLSFFWPPASRLFVCDGSCAIRSVREALDQRWPAATPGFSGPASRAARSRSWAAAAVGLRLFQVFGRPQALRPGLVTLAGHRLRESLPIPLTLMSLAAFHGPPALQRAKGRFLDRSWAIVLPDRLPA